MIQIYSPTNTNYENNGDMVLMPSECIISPMVLSSWKLTLTHPLDEEGRWKYIEENAVIKAPFKPYGDQLYRIKVVTKNDNSIDAEAEPIFFDSMDDHVLLDVRPTDKTGQEALDIILAGSKYTGRSDITKTATAYYYLMNTMECLCGNDDRAFVKRWGGEPIYNNFEVIINERCGGDYGVQLLYGKNIPSGGLTQEVDVSDVVTRIIPKAYNGHLLGGDTPWVDSPLISSYPTVKTRVIEYSHIKLRTDAEGETAGDIVCDTIEELRAELVRHANEEYEEGIDKPKVSIKCDMVLLQNTEEYKDYRVLETVGLGDTIHLKHDLLGIVTAARVVALDYNCLTESVESVDIGDVQTSYLSQVATTISSVNGIINSDGTVKADTIQGLINGAKAQLRLQNGIAERQDVRAILYEDLDPESPTYGALSIGTQGWQIANTRTLDGRDWEWTTAATANGIIADVITAGTINGITINGSTFNSFIGDILGVKIDNGRITLYNNRTGAVQGIVRGSTPADGMEASWLGGVNVVGLGKYNPDTGSVAPRIWHNCNSGQSYLGSDRGGLVLASGGNSYLLGRDADNNLASANVFVNGEYNSVHITTAPGGVGLYGSGNYDYISIGNNEQYVRVSGQEGYVRIAGDVRLDAPKVQDGTTWKEGYTGQVTAGSNTLKFVKGLLVSVS